MTLKKQQEAFTAALNDANAAKRSSSKLKSQHVQSDVAIARYEHSDEKVGELESPDQVTKATK